MKMYRWIMVVAAWAAGSIDGSRTCAQENYWEVDYILPAKPAQAIRFDDVIDGKKLDFPFTGRIPIIIRGERDGRVRVHDGRREGWVDKADFVLGSEALEYFHQRVQANPKDVFARFMRGEVWRLKGEPDKAIQDFDYCIRADPTDPNVYTSRAIAWLDKNKCDRALCDCDAAIRRDPTNARAFNSRGKAWTRKNNYDQAIRDYSQAIRLEPEYADAFENRGRLYVFKNELDKAIRDLDTAIRIDSMRPFALFCRGHALLIQVARGNTRGDAQAYAAFGDYDEAMRIVDRCTRAFHTRPSTWWDRNDFAHPVHDFDEVPRKAGLLSRTQTQSNWIPAR